MMMVIEAGWCRPSLGGCSGLHAAELTGLDPAGWSRTAIVSRDLADAQDRQPCDARIRLHLLPQPRGHAYLTTVTGQ